MDNHGKNFPESENVLARLCSLTERVVLLPVRHHSPACARAVREVILRLRPAAVLIEGPSDFNDRMDELFLPHRLPLAIYAWHEADAVEGGTPRTRGAFYPFCTWSPEWQALAAARKTGATAAFIDLPWADMANAPETNRYADAALRRGEYMKRLCAEMEVEDFDALWDALAEQDAALTTAEIIRRTHHFCTTRRLIEGNADGQDLRRESFMASQIESWIERTAGQLVVVTGGYHSAGILEFLDGGRGRFPYQPAVTGNGGIALTPYGSEDLDSLTGYNAGLPNPGFYDAAWQHGHERVAGVLLERVARMLRERKQTASAADLIAVRSTAETLAALRGHAHPWRRELRDGIIAALVKDEATAAHPFTAVLNEILRGGERGQLAEGTPAPPFVQDLKAQLTAHGLMPDKVERSVRHDLTKSDDRRNTCLLHRVAILGLPGFSRVEGVDFAVRDDLSALTETWALQWQPVFEARAVECCRYGASVLEAALVRLREMAAASRGARDAALLLVRAAEAGLAAEFSSHAPALAALIRSEPEFLAAAEAVGHLLYLYHYDEVLGVAGLADVGELLAEAWARAVWLIDFIGNPGADAIAVPDGLRTLVETFQRAGSELNLDRAEFIDALRHMENNGAQMPLLRGAAAGALWRLREADAGAMPQRLRAFADPAVLGDYLTGLFTLARELASREPALLRTISETIAEFSPDDFLAALPALRLAFTFFPPREKFDLAGLLFGNTTDAILVTRRLSASPHSVAATVAFESRLLATLRRYGIRQPAAAS